MLVARVSSLEDPLFYYFFTLLFLQYVNELFVGLQSLSNSRTAILSSPATSNNVIISPRSAVDKSTASHVYYLSIFQSLQPRLADSFKTLFPIFRFTIFQFVILHSYLPFGGEYRIRTDDPLLAKQVL